MSEAPLVTVAVPAFNHERFVLQTLESIRLQTYRPIEVVIVDDASSDGTPQRIDAWMREARGLESTFIRHDRNRGVCRTLNDAVRRARGAYLATIATDDEWLPDHLEDRVRLLESLPGHVGVVYGDAFKMDEEGRLLPTTCLNGRLGAKPPEGDVYLALLEGNFIPAMTTLIRRACFDAVGLYDEKLAFEDWDMWLRIARRFEFACSPRITAKYRIVQGSLMRTLLRASGSRLRTLQRIFAKALAWGHLEGPHRQAVRGELESAAEGLYRIRFPGHEVHLWRSLRWTRRLRTACLVAFATAGLPHETFTRFESWLAGVRGDSRDPSHHSSS